MDKLTVLGCGDAFASGGRSTTAFLIENGDHYVLLDCGASTLVRLKSLDFRLDKLKTIIITHFHGDHYAGIPFLIISNKFEWDGKLEWTIMGPPGLKNQIRMLQNAMYPGTGILVDELNLSFVEFASESIHLDELTVKALPVKHSPLSIPHGVRMACSGRILAFSGDTEWHDNLLELGRNADVFIMECFKDRESVDGHLSLKNIEENASQINCKRILLSHMSNDVLQLSSTPFERLYDGQIIEF